MFDVKIIFVLMSFGFVGMASAADSCTFDRENQNVVLRAVAKINPRGKLDVKQGQITWGHKRFGRTIFSYGGCDELGSLVRRETVLAKPRTQQQVVELAVEMATRFWSNKHVSAHAATLAFRYAITNLDYELELVENGTLFRISSPNFDVLNIVHTYADGVDVVEIDWHRIF